MMKRLRKTAIIRSARSLESWNRKKGLVFDDALSDTFDGTSVNTAKWYEHHPSWTGGGGNRDPDKFRFDVSCLEVTGGELRIHTKRITNGASYVDWDKSVKTYTADQVQYLTGCLASKKMVRYGYFELDAKLSPNIASSAWWIWNYPVYKEDDYSQMNRRVNPAQPLGCYEIDMFEYGGSPRYWDDKFHMQLSRTNWLWCTKDEAEIRSVPVAPRPAHPTAGVGRPDSIGRFVLPFDPRADFHTYGFFWDEQVTELYADGAFVCRMPNCYNHMFGTLMVDTEMFRGWGFPLDSELPSYWSVKEMRTWTRPDMPVLTAPESQPRSYAVHTIL